MTVFEAWSAWAQFHQNAEQMTNDEEQARRVMNIAAAIVLPMRRRRRRGQAAVEAEAQMREFITTLIAREMAPGFMEEGEESSRSRSGESITEPPEPHEATLEGQDDCPMEDETVRPEGEDPGNWEDPDEELLSEAMASEFGHLCLHALRVARGAADDY